MRTYALAGERGSSVVCANGAAAHLARPGDLIIIATFTMLEDAAARTYQPKVVLVDGRNRVRNAHADEVGGPRRRWEEARDYRVLVTSPAALERGCSDHGKVI